MCKYNACIDNGDTIQTISNEIRKKLWLQTSNGNLTYEHDACAISYLQTEQTIYHKQDNYIVVLQYETSCEFLNFQQLKMVLHKQHIYVVVLQGEF